MPLCRLSPHLFRSFCLAFAVIVTNLSLTGCAAQPMNPDAMQIIVKFEPDVTNADSRDLLNDLSATAKVPVLYKRAMSGGVHLLIIDAKPAEAQEALAALAKRRDIISAEPDRKMKAE